MSSYVGPLLEEHPKLEWVQRVCWLVSIRDDDLLMETLDRHDLDGRVCP